MKKPETTLFTLILGIIIAIPLMLLAILLYSFTLVKLWLWFLVPVLGLPPIGLAQAYGIMLIVAMVSHPADLKEDDHEVSLLKSAKYLYFRPLLTLLFGWIVAQFLAA